MVKRISFETFIFFSGMRVTLDFQLDGLCWCFGRSKLNSTSTLYYSKLQSNHLKVIITLI